MNKNYTLYVDGRLIGALSVDYNIGRKKFYVAAQAYTLLKGARVETPRFINRSYRTAVRAAIAAYAQHFKCDPDAIVLRDDPCDIDLVDITEDRDHDVNWQQSRAGRRVWAYDTRPQDIHLAEIAYGLREGRFACQTLGLHTYSVGQHSVHASHLGDQSPKARMAKLVHDAHEATLKDMPKPLRNQPGMEDYNAACDARQRVINVWAGLDPDAHHMYDVKEADMIMLATERRDLMAPNEHLWAKNDHAPAKRRISVWDQPFTVYAFLVTFLSLAKRVCPRRYDEANRLLAEHVAACRAEELYFSRFDLAGAVKL